MPNEVGSKLKVYCRNCRTETNHELKFVKEEWGDADAYRFRSQDCFAECCGCETASFVNVYDDFEVRVWDEATHESVPERTIRSYPRTIVGHRPLDELSGLPDVVRQVYEETLSAVQEGAFTLAGLGLRAVIEAVCNERGIKGRSLQSRIGGLAKAGLISKNDEQLMHGIRFLGNDAAHQIKKAPAKSIEVGLKIVEHLISTVYLLRHQADGTLDLSFSSHDELFEHLDDRASDLSPGTSVTFLALLGNDRRRLLDGPREYEAEFSRRVAAGESDFLVIGEVIDFHEDGEGTAQTYKRLPNADAGVRMLFRD